MTRSFARWVVCAVMPLAACTDTTTNPPTQLNLDRPIDIAFACYGGLRYTEGDKIAIGAGTTLAELLADETIGEKLPSLKQASRSIATPQVRNMGTVGGNLLQRPRCWYYRSGFGLLGGRRDGDLRGIVVYRVATVEEARALAASDPAVKAGRLRLDARRWMTFKGLLK